VCFGLRPSQRKLLRVLDTGVFRDVGGTHEIRVDVRVLAATNRDLQAMVRQPRNGGQSFRLSRKVAHTVQDERRQGPDPGSPGR
jgi:transcriptional regulator with AAA-type ATPase domain